MSESERALSCYGELMLFFVVVESLLMQMHDERIKSARMTIVSRALIACRAPVHDHEGSAQWMARGAEDERVAGAQTHTSKSKSDQRERKERKREAVNARHAYICICALI